MAYTAQITFLLFLNLADEQTRLTYNRKSIVPSELGWVSLLERDGEELERPLGFFHVKRPVRRSGFISTIDPSVNESMYA